MLSSLILATAMQIGPFFEKRPDYCAVRPFVAVEGADVDCLWPLFAKHRDWWRFCFLAYRSEHAEPGGHSFSLLPFWFSGTYPGKGDYAGLFPIYGRHPNVATVYDLEFVLWPVWMRYRMPRGRTWLETQSILFPFFSSRRDGSWSVWPFYGVGNRRESVHRYALWPFFTWAGYRKDRDTSGEGFSWMVWPLWASVERERESQTMFIPPFFSFAETECPVRAGRGNSAPSVRLRCPWPFFEYESGAGRSRISVFPLYEKNTIFKTSDGTVSSSVTRFGWRLVELYDDETRVFPFWASGRSHKRLWPFWEQESCGGMVRNRVLSLIPIRWMPAVERNWAKFWTFYENESTDRGTEHSLFWGIFKWRTSE